MIKLNRIIVEQEELILQEEEVMIDAFPTQLNLLIKGNVYCGIKNFTNKELNIHLKKDCHLTLEFLLEVEDSKNKITIENEEGSSVDLHYACLYKGKNELTITSVLNTNNNNNQIFVRAVEEDGTLLVNALGSIEEETENNVYLEEIRALTKNNNSIKIRPDLIVKTDFVNAIHNATIGPVSESELFYLESKGLSKEKAKDLIKEGFLKGIIEKEDLKD